jgi:hypothetical protein
MKKLSLYRFFINDPEKARAEFRTWTGQVDINIARTLANGFIDQWTHNAPETIAEKIGADKWEQIKTIGA